MDTQKKKKTSEEKKKKNIDCLTEVERKPQNTPVWTENLLSPSSAVFFRCYHYGLALFLIAVSLQDVY